MFSGFKYPFLTIKFIRNILFIIIGLIVRICVVKYKSHRLIWLFNYRVLGFNLITSLLLTAFRQLLPFSHTPRYCLMAD